MSTTVLRDFLRQLLPEYMIPAFFVLLDVLPLTPNGKVDRLALPAPDMSRHDPQESFVPPRTPVEEVLAGIWADVLGLERVGIYDNFFELGGDSLLATSIITQIQEDFQIELSFRTFFEARTVAVLAECLVKTHSAIGANVNKIAQILLQLHQLSDAEVNAMLAEE
jgi:acyl carrier protein